MQRHGLGQGQQRQENPVRVIITCSQLLIRTHARIRIDTAGLRHAHDRVQQQHTTPLLGGAFGQLLVDPMQRVAGVRGDDAGVA